MTAIVCSFVACVFWVFALRPLFAGFYYSWLLIRSGLLATVLLFWFGFIHCVYVCWCGFCGLFVGFVSLFCVA